MQTYGKSGDQIVNTEWAAVEHSLLEKIQWHLESKQNCRTEFFWDSSCCTFSGVPFPLKQLDTLAVGQLNALAIEIQAHPNLYYRNL